MANDKDEARAFVEAMAVVEVESGGLKWKYLPEVELGPDTYFEDFKAHLLPLVRPKWREEGLDVKVFDEGISNKLVAIFEREKGLRKSGEDVVLLRVNGVGTEAFIDRRGEIITMISLNRAGLGPPIYCQLRNGLCYGFMPGRNLRVDEVREEKMMARIIRTMVQLHAVEIPSHFSSREPILWKKIYNFLNIVPNMFGDPAKDKW